MTWVAVGLGGASLLLGNRQADRQQGAAQQAAAGAQLYVPTAFLPGGAYGIYGGVNPASPGVSSPQNLPGGNPLVGGSGYGGPFSSFAAGPGAGGAVPLGGGSATAAIPPRPVEPVRPTTGGVGPFIRYTQEMTAYQQQLAQWQQQYGSAAATAGKPTGFSLTGQPQTFGVGQPALDIGALGTGSIKQWGTPTGGPAPTGTAAPSLFQNVMPNDYIQYLGAPVPGGSVASPIDTTIAGSIGDLEPTRQLLRDISLGQGVDPGVAGALQNTATANLYGGNTPGMSAAYLDLLRQQAQPYEQQAFQGINQNLFSRGRLGMDDSVTGEAYRQFSRGLGEADVARQRLALDFGSTEAQNVFGRGLQAATLGDQLQSGALGRILNSAQGAEGLARFGSYPLELALQFGVARSNAAVGGNTALAALSPQRANPFDMFTSYLGAGGPLPSFGGTK